MRHPPETSLLPAKGGAMTNPEWESGEEQIDEEGRNPTQRKIDEDVDPTGEERRQWEETGDEPHQGEEGQDIV
jgi:hypothetical protein